MNVASFLDRAAERWPLHPAIRDGGAVLDQRGLFAVVAAAADRLANRGLTVGDRVAVLADNRWENLALHLAIARAGMVAVPLNTRLTHTELLAIVRLSGARLVAADAAHRAAAAEIGAPHAAIDADERDSLIVTTTRAPTTIAAPIDRRGEPAQLYFTSGTTGAPKGVVLTHDNIVAHAISTIAELRLDERDVWGHIAPMFHLADAWAQWAITAVGGCHAFVRRFEAAATFDAIARDRITITNLVPTMLQRMVALDGAAQRDTASLRAILSGGAPIAPETVRRIVAVFGCEYVQTYGMTETSPYLTMSRLDLDEGDLPPAERLRRSARTGRPVLGVELRVVDADGAPVPRDDATVGEIQVRGPTVTSGYWNAPEQTAQAFTADGFLKTGDLATIDATGSVNIVDRAKDVILTGGETVYSTEVEHRLLEHPAIVECAAFADPDDDLGERVVAAIVCRADLAPSDDELRAFCRETLAGFKAPREFRRMAELPRTGSGKISKRALRREPPQP